MTEKFTFSVIEPEESAATQLLGFADECCPGSFVYFDHVWMHKCRVEKVPQYEDLFALFSQHGEPGPIKNWMSTLMFPHPALRKLFGFIPLFYVVHPKQNQRWEQFLRIVLLPVPVGAEPPCRVICPQVVKCEEGVPDPAADVSVAEDFGRNGKGRIREIAPVVYEADDSRWPAWIERFGKRFEK